MTIEAGKLNKRITIERPVAVAGEGVTSWATVCTVWAQIRPLVGNRRYQAQQLNADVAGQVVIRYRRDITTSMRILYSVRYFQIISIIDPDEKHETLEIDYKEVLD